MPLSWNEIKTRATAFSKEWERGANEEADAKEFLIDFLNIFGISRKRVATFEHRVKKLSEADGYIDLLWKGMLLVEMKSHGKDLLKAYQQAKDYCHGLKEYELPQLILVSDFQTFVLYDTEGNSSMFTLQELANNIHHFGAIAGYQKRTYKEQDPVNLQAAELMGKLHDRLKAIGYTGHALELYLVRLLFCLFADDTGIFEKDTFNDYLQLKTSEDGSDLARAIAELFQVLNTPAEQRLKNLDESLAAFPYVNGKLFEEQLPFASFDSSMRSILLECCTLDWGKISPAIFGSLFQSVMDEKARRNLGAHYTSEKNILKLIKPLFLDELWEEFHKAQNSTAQLQKLHAKISELRFLDPACGCGNFLIIAYRELRLLEIEIIKQLLKLQGYREEVLRDVKMDASYLIKCNVDQFYGIEYEEFPAQIARTAMWLMDHQMNLQVSNTFGEYYVRLPLQKAATIVHGNALRVDWQSILDAQAPAGKQLKYNYILGNPPFIGHQWRNEAQMQDMELVFGDAKRAGRLDYVAAWYIKAAQYMQLSNPEGKFSGVRCAFVSTNSISQGEQVGILWKELFNKFKVKIHFAHRTFKWSNEARGNAAVHVVIIGFSNFDIDEKSVFEYDNSNGEPFQIKTKNINPYLTEGKDIFIESRGKPIHGHPEMIKGSQPTDGGALILNREEYIDAISKDEELAKWIRPYYGAYEFINNQPRYCLWLKNASPSELKASTFILDRIEKVKSARLQSPTPSVREFAKYPTLFTQDRQPVTNYLVIPEVSSINRKYIPIGFLTPDIVCSNKLQIITNATFYMYGVLQSVMHMTWTRYVCGRMKSDFSYSPQVYNNFPWPEDPSVKQVAAVEAAAQEVLNARAQFPNSSLADLYDPNTMPPVLVKAHQALDRAVDLCYRPQPFPSETKRIEFLFELYDKYTAGLFAKEKPKRKKSG